MGNKTQKFTNKNIQFNLVQNTNDETVPGWEVLENINTNPKAKSIIPRNGAAKSVSLATAPIVTHVTEVDIESVLPDTTTPPANWVSCAAFYDANTGKTEPSFILTSENTTNITQVAFQFNALSGIIGYNATMAVNMWEFDVSTNTIGKQIGIGTAFPIAGLLNGGLQFRYLDILTDHINNEPVRITAGEAYLIKLQFSTAIPLINIGDLLLQPGIIETNNYAVKATEFPTQPTVYTGLPYAIYSKLTAFAMNQQSNPRDITGITLLSADTYDTLISTTTNPVGSQFRQGVLSALVNYPIPYNPSSYMQGYLEPLIQPKLNSSGYPIPNLSVPYMYSGDQAMQYGVAAVSASIGNLYPAALYGAKVENSIHDYGMFLGSQLGNRALDFGSKATVNLNENYPMFKRPEGDEYFHRCQATIDPSVSDLIPYPNFAPTDVNWSNPNPTDTSTCKAGFIQIVSKEFMGWPYANTGVWGESPIDKLHLRPGEYEYAVEYIDKTGYPYMTTREYQGMEKPLPKNPPSNVHGTIVYVKTDGWVEMSEYISGIRNTYGNLQVYIDSIGRRATHSFIGIPIPSGPITNATKADYPIINLYRRGINYLTEGGGLFKVVNTPDSDFRLIKTFYPEDYSTDWPVWPTETAAFIQFGPFGWVPAVPTYTGPRMGYWYWEDIVGESDLGSTILDQKDYYIPRPADFTIQKGKILAFGDPKYPNYIFPSRDFKTDFRIEDAQQVKFPAGDTFFTACANLNDDIIAFSKHGTWRIRQTSADVPYYTVQTVSTNFGCVTSSKAIVNIGQRLLVPTTVGLQWFDGYNYTPADSAINNIWNSIDYSVSNIQSGGTPDAQFGNMPSFTITAVYDDINKNVLYTMPSTNINEPKVVYCYNIQIGEWSTYTIMDIKGIYKNTLINTPGYYKVNGDIFEFSTSFKYDFTDCGLINTVIPTRIKTLNLDFGETTMFHAFRIWGNGKINAKFYFDRETTATSVYNNIDLSELSTIGVEFPLGWSGNYFAFEIEALDKDFELKAFEALFTNTGIKVFKNISGE